MWNRVASWHPAVRSAPGLDPPDLSAAPHPIVAYAAVLVLCVQWRPYPKLTYICQLSYDSLVCTTVVPVCIWSTKRSLDIAQHTIRGSARQP